MSAEEFAEAAVQARIDVDNELKDKDISSEERNALWKERFTSSPFYTQYAEKIKNCNTGCDEKKT